MSTIGPARSPAHRSVPREFPKLGVALSCTAVAGLLISPILGTIGAAFFLVAAMAVMAVRPLATLNDLGRFLPLLLLPLLAIVSTLWSDAPSRTMRAGLQILLTGMAAIAICRNMGARQLILVLFVGYLGICLWSLLGIPAVRHSGAALLGPYQSKNQLAYGAQTLLIAAMAIGADRHHPMFLRLFALVAIPLSFIILFFSQSAGANLSAALTMVMFPGLLAFGRVKMPTRIGILCAIIILSAVAIVFLPDIEQMWADVRVNVLKKDATYTGRTYLWDFARALIAERPVVGHGYGAFWRQGNIDAEGLWRYAGIAQRSGFNFHNAFLEIMVDLGAVGFIALIVTCFGVIFAGLFRQFTRPTVPMVFFLTYTITLYIRNNAESGLLLAFNLVMVIWFATAVYAFDPDPNAPARPTRLRGDKLPPR